MNLSISDFDAFHQAVHDGKCAFDWQNRLLDQIVRDKTWPEVLDLPTGTGKSTCIDIALFALALDATNCEAERWCPRRIAMVVDRRIVVDQVAERGRRLARALTTQTGAVVVEIANRLRSLSRAGEEPLGVFTLRGGMPKDDGWARTPDQPLVIASTVDQVGSRMLMQGYGVSQGMKPVHAGLLANDTLLLLDEVHLSEPFRQTLDQVARLRTRFIKTGVKTRCVHSCLSATPSTTSLKTFTLNETDKNPGSVLGKRLHATKPVTLVEVEDRVQLEVACVTRARELLERHRTVAVIVNRIASAGSISRQLAETLGSGTIVTLLTGRMRPLDRDDVLRDLRPAIATGRSRNESSPRRVIVGTQCIEAGADFDFDALVTEAASLDSLRQRFGRVDRLGDYDKAEGVIIYDTSDKEDPVYGKSIAETIKWLKEQEKERQKKFQVELKKLRQDAKKLSAESKEQAEIEIRRKCSVDFGVLAMEMPGADRLAKMLAPQNCAATLLPAYLDLWAQTSPAATQIPDVSLWLHGPYAGPADVQIVWRVDLTESVLQQNNKDLATAIVAAVRPSSLEAVSLPFVTARDWLAGKKACDVSDIEGESPEAVRDGKSASRRALRWRGEESEIVSADADTGAALEPGDTIIVPASYGGIRNGCFDATSTQVVTDRAEQAQLFGRGRPVLRMHSAVTQMLGISIPLDELANARNVLGVLATNQDWPEWKRLWAAWLAKARCALVVSADPPWSVLEARRVPSTELRSVLQPEESVENGVEVTTDSDDSCHTGRSVSLAEHSARVEAIAREYASKCGLNMWLAEHIAVAAWLHDIGKADRRFQVMLRGGSEIEFFKDEAPWAKSAISPGARETHRLAQRRSGYPPGCRHEVQSLAMIQSELNTVESVLRKVVPTEELDLDLVLHLVASHHGYCRPFAPAVIDSSPVEMVLLKHQSITFGSIDFTSTSSSNGLHRLDSPLADRFWALLAKYGWQELCWFEAILRLADHCASEEEQIES
jgi:CRISPR-associated endonuclease/helicase Cas3